LLVLVLVEVDSMAVLVVAAVAFDRAVSLLLLA